MGSFFSFFSTFPSIDATQPQVFINFRGEDVRCNFAHNLVKEMDRQQFNVFIDERNIIGSDIETLLTRIEESKVAIVIFSKKYTNSYWALTELVRIKECVDEGILTACPIFYKIKPSVVRGLTGDFGYAFKSLKIKYQHDPVAEKWEQAIIDITQKQGMEFIKNSTKNEIDFIHEIIEKVKSLVEHIKKNPDQGGQVKTIQNIQSEAVQIIRQPESVQNRQLLEVNPQGSMFINARQLRINESKNWTYESESPNEAVVAKLKECYDLDVCGKFYAGELTPGKKYEVVFVVKIEDTMPKFDILAKTTLMVPDANKLLEKELKLNNLPKNQWVEIPVGVFFAWAHEEKVACYLYQADTPGKKITGLQVKGATIRPTNPEEFQNKQPEPVQIPKPNVNHKGCLFNARQLKISGSFNARYWIFESIPQQPNEAAIEVAKMKGCFDLKVFGELNTGKLKKETRYEVVFVVKIEDTMSKWDQPAKVTLIVPGEDNQERELQFVDLIKNEWIEIEVGVFHVEPHERQIKFNLIQDDPNKQKMGLVVKGAIIRPKA